MRYAKIVFGLAVVGPFDYSIPAHLEKNIAPGMRVKVNFNHRPCIGYVVKLSPSSDIPNIKPILEVIDETPVVSHTMLLLTQKVSVYYFCSWGEAIESALPSSLRKGKLLEAEALPEAPPKTGTTPREPNTIVLQDISHKARWDTYCKYILSQAAQSKSVLIIVPDVAHAINAQAMLAAELGINATLLYRGAAQEVSAWQSVKNANYCVAVGTRSAIFAPARNLGLIILEEEHDTVYKQEQAPHYHAREVALLRQKVEHATIILGSSAPSVESFHLAHARGLRAGGRPHVEYRAGSLDGQPAEVKAVFAKELFSKRFSKGKILTRFLEEAITRSLCAKEKTLILINRKGFATYAACQTCGEALQCPRCELNLVYYFEEAKLRCNHCNFTMEKPMLCPACNKGYIKFTGIGVEKVESELSRLFPQAKIKMISAKVPLALTDADIFVSTSAVLKKSDRFDLVAILSIDNALNRIDFRASEKVFSALMGLRGLTKKMLLIQTMLTRHHVFEAIQKNNFSLFYEKEIALRKQLQYPPFWHFVALKIRGRSQQKVKDAAENYFNRFKELNINKNLKIESAGPGSFPKLRGNYYYQVLLRAPSVKIINSFLKLHLKKIRHSGIIVTVDVDPL